MVVSVGKRGLEDGAVLVLFEGEFLSCFLAC